MLHRAFHRDFEVFPAPNLVEAPPDAPLCMPKQRFEAAPATLRGPARIDARSFASTLAARTFAVTVSIAAATAALALSLQFADGDGVGALDLLRGVLIFGATWWLAWGASMVLLGLSSGAADRPRPVPARPPTSDGAGRVAILVPICREDPVETFSRVAAMEASLAAAGASDRFDIAILSDTRDKATADRERHWFRRLTRERVGNGGIHYRQRSDNAGRKAGNIEDFIRSSGAAYEFALILDADSLMEGATIREMVRRMEAEPDLAVLQTVPRIVSSRSRFGRAMQFAASLHAPVFTRGLAMTQGATGPYWGHNALLRVAAWAECCGLPELRGRPPLGGPVLSHDYVEAALLARAGWRVRLDPDLGGSYEEGTETIVDHARRDRRWCQGNLQHMRVLGAPALRPWSRFVFVQGVATYIAPVFWLGFLAACIADAVGVRGGGAALAALPGPAALRGDEAQAVALAIGVLGLLFAPKILIVLRAVLSDEARAHGGALRLLRSSLAEIAFSIAVAPVLLMYQARAACEVLTGGDSGWPARRSPASCMALDEAWRESRWIVGVGFATVLLVLAIAPAALLWILPAALPMALAPILIAWSSKAGARGLFSTPEELCSPPVIAARQRILARWRRTVASGICGAAPLA